jgi:hypothetical protein
MQSGSSTPIATASVVDADVLEHFQNELARLGEPILTDTAILMGDPGCKGVLTLHSLVAEEEAALEEKLGRPVTLSDLKSPNPITFPWRHFSCAGDDHTGIGPDRYLDNIGKCHEKNQMVLSTGKHVKSKLGGFYCERVLFKGPETVMTQRTADYNQHILVDSVKVRLLSPETKDREAESETNPAIGKARLLFKQLLWAPPGWENTLRVLVPRRFFGRMRKHLPIESNGDFSRIIEIPSILGGLGMCPPRFSGWDLENVLMQLSIPHLRILTHIFKGRELDTMAKRALSRYSSDRYARGVRLDDAVDLIIDRLFDLSWTKEESLVLKETRTKFKLRDTIGYRTVMKHVSKLGYETKNSLKRKLARSYNQACLMIDPPSRGFKSASWEAREISFQSDLLIANFTNEVEDEYDIGFIYDAMMSYGNSERLLRAIRTREQYLDPTFQMEFDGENVQLLKQLNETIPDTKLPSMEFFV